MAEQNGTRRLKLGIIGCGLAVKYLHWPALKQMQDKYEIVMTCDIDPKAAQEVMQLAGVNVPSTADYHELLAATNVEVVLSSLPIELSAPVMMDAIRSGKHIIGEKPLAANWQEAVELVNVAEASPEVVVEIAENFHYRRDFKLARKWIDEGKLGEVFLIELEGKMWVDSSVSFAQTPWRQKNHVQYRGGVIADAAVHHAAGMRELGGEVAQIQAYTKSMHPIMAAPDTITANLKFKNGVIGNLRYSGATHGAGEKFFDGAIYGDKGTILVGSGKLVLKRPDQPDETNQIENFDGGYYDEFANFWEAVVNGAPVVSTPREALQDWEIIMKALDSAESGQTVNF